MQLPPGTRLGPYEVVSPIEAGGMGSIYKGRDTRLMRDVAIKVIPVGLLDDERTLARFLREAQASALVTHPNVVGIFDVGDAEVEAVTPFGAKTVGIRFLVEEYVEGSSLRRVLRRGRPPLGCVVSWGLEVARGLAAAHAKGIVHRDLKPENILIDFKGNAKIADFGLVRWIYPDASAPSSAADGGPGGEITRSGFIVGTVGYMSPEQVRGERVGTESDLFVFGIVLYEMLAGASPFVRDDADATFAAILGEEAPPLEAIVPRAPPRLAKLVASCLQKDPAQRPRSAEDVAKVLERENDEIKARRPGTDLRASAILPVIRAGPARREIPPLAWLAAAGAVVLAFASGWTVGRLPSFGTARGPESAAAWDAEALDVALPAEVPADAALSPDGWRLALAGGDVVPLDGGRPLRLAPDTGSARAPAFATDGRSLVFASHGIWEVALSPGASPARRADDGLEPTLSVDGRSLAWARRGPAGSELWVASRDGSRARRVASAPGSVWRFPAFVADARTLVFYEVRPGPDGSASGALLFSTPVSGGAPAPVGLETLVDPTARPVSLASGDLLVRSWPEGRALLVAEASATARPLPFGASLTLLAATPDGRNVVSRAGSGPLIRWRRAPAAGGPGGRTGAAVPPTAPAAPAGHPR